MMRRLSACLVAFTLGACASNVHGPAAGPASVTPETRELQPLPLHAVVGDHNFFRTQVESAEAPAMVFNNGLHQVTIPIGTSQPIHCFVYPKAINLAQTLHLFVRSVVSHVDHHHIDRIDAGQLAGMPYLALVTSYTVDHGDDPGLGQVKYVIARADSSTTLCMHDEPGYQKTFERITSGFIGGESFDDTDNEAARKLLVWRALSVETSGTAHVGVLEERLYEGEAGYAFAASRSMILPAGDGNIVAIDDAENQFSDGAGSIVEAKYVKIIDDVVAYNLTLSQDGNGAYRVDGRAASEVVNYTLKSDEALPDFATQSASLRKLFAAKSVQTKAHWLRFLPDDPSKFSTVDFEKGDVAGRSGTLSVGAMRSYVELDEKGMETRVKGPQTTLERIWQGRGDHS